MTISLEASRNRIRGNHYLTEVAQIKALNRRHHAAKYMMPDMTVTFVEFGLEQKWSSEQIAGVGKIIDHKASHEQICDYVQRDKLTGGKLYKKLRHGRRTYRKGIEAKCVIIPNRVGIECRPAIVNNKKRFGGWKADTVLGKQGTGAIVSLVERKSRLYLIRKAQLTSQRLWLVCCGNTEAIFHNHSE